jgi:hypothetical protein
MAKLEEPRRVEYRWFDVSLLCVVFEKFGRELLEGNRVRANNKRNILVDSLVYSNLYYFGFFVNVINRRYILQVSVMPSTRLLFRQTMK